MKRRVYHLAKAASVDVADALRRLREAGFPVSRGTDLVRATHAVEALSVVRGQPQRQAPCQPTAPAAPHDGSHEGRPEPGHPTTRPSVPSKAEARSPGQQPAVRSSVAYLTEDDVLRVHFALVDLFAAEGDPIVPPGLRDANLLASAMTRPQTGLGTTDKYRSLPEKGAALFHSLIKNHAFHNGNKRTALVSTLTFFDRNGWRVVGTLSDDAMFDFITSVAADRFGAPDSKAGTDAVVQSIAAWWRDHLTSQDHSLRDMTVSDFLSSCEIGGARVTDRGQSYLVHGPNGKMVSINHSTRKLAGGVVKNYAGRLGLAGPSVGLDLDEFRDNQQPEVDLIRRFLTLLRRLAYA